MKQILKLCTISAAMLMTLITQAQVGNKWVKSVPGAEGKALTLDLTGNVYVAGKAANDIKVIKYDSVGTEVWTHTYAGFGTGTDEPSKILVDNSGNVYVGGFASGVAADVCVLYKLDPTGNLLWQDTMNTDPVGSGYNRVNDMAFDNSGNIVLCGAIQSPVGTMGYPTMLVSKHDVNGNELWRDITEVNYGYNYFYNLATDANGNVYSVGTEFTSSPPSNQFIVRKNDASGTTVWQDVYNADPTVNVAEVAIDVQLDGSGNVYAAGNTEASGNRDLLIRKYDPAGNSIWTKTFSTIAGANSDETKKLAVTSNGDAYIVGRTEGQVLLVKYDANGNLAWNQTYTYGMTEDAFDIAVDESAGNLIVSCYSRRTSFYVDIVTLKYDLAGNLIWEKRQPSPGQSGPAAAMIGANHNVYVTGTDGGSFTTIRMMDADASLPQSVTIPGTYDFNNTNVKTAVSADFSSLSIQGQVVVSLLLNAVANTDWCAGTNQPNDMSDYRWVVTSTLDLFTAAIIISLPELSDAIGGFHGMANPANFSIYQRELDGQGPFCKLVTTFANGKLSAPIDHFSEFFIGSETDTFQTAGISTLEPAAKLNIYPNPAYDIAKLSFDLKESSVVSIAISDIQGKEINEVYNGRLTPGNHQIELNVGDLSNGLYMCRLTTTNGSITTKLTVVR